MSEDWSIKSEWKGRRLNPYEHSWYRYHMNKFRRLALNVYKWSNLPEGVDDYLIEKYLFEDGMCIIWNSPEFGMNVSRCLVTQWDAWKRPLTVRPVYDGIPNILDEIPIEDCVFLTDLYDLGHKRSEALDLVSELVSIQSVIDTQNTNQATPLMAIAGNNSVRQKLQNCIRRISEGYKVMFLEDDLSNSIKPLNLNSPYNVQLLVQYKKDIENEILSYLGIDSQQAFQKKERMIVDEQEGNDELLNYLLADGLKARQRAIDGNTIGFQATVEIQTFVRPEMTDDGETSSSDSEEGGDVQTD